MSENKKWNKVGKVEDLKKRDLQSLKIEGRNIALSHLDGKFGAISGNCLHVGGPLGDGEINKDGYVVCPWHSWMFHCQTGEARPGIPAAVSKFDLKEEGGELFINLAPATKAHHPKHPPHSLTRELKREEGKIRVAGISTTAMNPDFPRYSTSEALLEESLKQASDKGCETKLIRLNDLKFKNCEGYYSKSADACTWPCTITQMDSTDELTEVYDAFVYWADVILISTSIRWGSPSSLYYKMIERMNCIQNQVTIADRVLIRDKVVSFIITGGQDNVQGTAGQMLTFFSELGFQFPQFPFIAHTLGWDAENMEKNVDYVKKSESLKEGARALSDRAVELASKLVDKHDPACSVIRGGRKAQSFTTES